MSNEEPNVVVTHGEAPGDGLAILLRAVCNGHDVNHVIDAALNLLVHSYAQAIEVGHTTAAEVETEIAGFPAQLREAIGIERADIQAGKRARS